MGHAGWFPKSGGISVDADYSLSVTDSICGSKRLRRGLEFVTMVRVGIPPQGFILGRTLKGFAKFAGCAGAARASQSKQPVPRQRNSFAGSSSASAAEVWKALF